MPRFINEFELLLLQVLLGQVLTQSLIPTQRFALDVVLVYQLALLYQFKHGLDLCIGLKAFLKVA